MRAEHRITLHVLAFLFFRMGRMESAGRIYAALRALPAGDAKGPEGAEGSARPQDWRSSAGLAAVAIEQEEGETALAHIRAAVDAANFPPHVPERTVLDLMQAKALWLCDRKDEARGLIASLTDADTKKAAS